MSEGQTIHDNSIS